MTTEPHIIDGRYLRIYVSIYSHQCINASTYKPMKNAFSDAEYFFYDVPLPSKYLIKEVTNTSKPRELLGD